MVVEPVLVPVESLRTAKLCAEPRYGVADAKGGKRNAANAATTNRIKKRHFILDAIRSFKILLISLEKFLIVFSFKGVIG